MSYVSGGTVSGVLRLSTPSAAPALSAAGEGRIYFDGTVFLASQNGGAYASLAGATSGWTDDGTVVRLTTATDQVGIGTATPAANTKFEVLGDATNRNVAITGGNGGGAVDGGMIAMLGGQGGATGIGGNVTIISGEGGGTSGDSGSIEIGVGPVTSGNTGSISIYTPDSFAAAGASTGGITLYTGGPGTGGRSGSITLEVGSGGLGNSGGIYLSTPWQVPDADPDVDGTIFISAGGNLTLETTNGLFVAVALSGQQFKVGEQSTLSQPMLSIQDDSSVSMYAGNNSNMRFEVTGSTATIDMMSARTNIATDGAYDYIVNIGSGGGTVTIGDANVDSTLIVDTGSFVVNAAQSSLPSGASIGSDAEGTGLVLVQRGFTSIGDGSVAAGLSFGPVYYDTKNGSYIRMGNSVYIDGSGVNNLIRAGDGSDIENVFPYTVENNADTYNLATAGAIDADPLEPGTVVVRVILNGGTVFSSVTDNGAGSFPVSAALPAGGTVNYAARTLTGTTAGLALGSRVEIAFVNANTAGESITVRAGDGNGAAVSGGDLTLLSGAGGSTSGDSGDATLDVGSVTSGTTGTVSVGATNASAVIVGRTGATTTVAGTIDATGATNLGAITTVSGDTTLNATQSNVLVDASGGPVTITLPAAAGVTRRGYAIKKIDATANAVTIDGDGAETIDGSATKALVTQYDALRIVCNGSAWFIM